MRLLSKSDIAVNKAREKRQSIDEGLKIAHRVDNLRKVQADEEQALEKFRKETLAQINKEVKEHMAIRDSLIGEVKELESRKREALLPLTEEKNLLIDLKRELEVKEMSLMERNNENITREKTLDKRQKDLTATQKRVEEARMLVNKELEEATQKHAEAKHVLEDARKMFDAFSSQCTQREKDVVEKERIVTEKQKKVLEQEELLRKARQEFVDDQRRFSDRETTLLKELSR